MDGLRWPDLLVDELDDSDTDAHADTVADEEREMDADAVGLCVLTLVSVCEPVAQPLAESVVASDTDTVELKLAVVLKEPEGVGEPLSLRDTEAQGLADAHGVLLGERDTVAAEEREPERVGDAVAQLVAVGDVVVLDDSDAVEHVVRVAECERKLVE